LTERADLSRVSEDFAFFFKFATRAGEIGDARARAREEMQTIEELYDGE